MTPALSVVSDTTGPVPEALSERIRRLQAEARDMAREHVAALEQALQGVSRLAAEIADGGEAYPVGARQLARQLIAEADGRAQTLDAILVRTART
ncbi:MAG TPA: hypothetical protein VEA44_07370 [Caulobacter sp.]|nr:hypothetical protein [Caulobacter sp.]